MLQKNNFKAMLVAGLLLTIGFVTFGLVNFGFIAETPIVTKNTTAFKAGDFIVSGEVTDHDFRPSASLLVEPAAGGTDKAERLIHLYEPAE